MDPNETLKMILRTSEKLLNNSDGQHMEAKNKELNDAV
jgi:hypothetical protein